MEEGVKIKEERDEPEDSNVDEGPLQEFEHVNVKPEFPVYVRNFNVTDGESLAVEQVLPTILIKQEVVDLDNDPLSLLPTIDETTLQAPEVKQEVYNKDSAVNALNQGTDSSPVKPTLRISNEMALPGQVQTVPTSENESATLGLPSCHMDIGCVDRTTLKCSDGSHPTKKQFRCDHCEASFSTRSNFNQHLKTHSSERPYQCRRCDSTFKSVDVLHRHRLTHSGYKRFVCTHCEAKFKRKSTLDMHMLTHSVERPFACTQCEATFKHKNYLVTHKRTHSVVRSFECKICGKSFKNRQVLHGHKIIHSVEKPFACPLCESTFKRKVELNNHMLIHSGERPCACTDCGKTYVRKGDLKRHRLTHTVKKPLACTQ